MFEIGVFLTNTDRIGWIKNNREWNEMNETTIHVLLNIKVIIKAKKFHDRF